MWHFKNPYLFNYPATYFINLYVLPYSEIIGEENYYYLEKDLKETTIIIVDWGEQGKSHEQTTHLHHHLKEWSHEQKNYL